MRAANSRLLRINKLTVPGTQVKCYEITFHRRTVHSATHNIVESYESDQLTLLSVTRDKRRKKWLKFFNWFDLTIYGLTIAFAWPQRKFKIKIYYHLPFFFCYKFFRFCFFLSQPITTALAAKRYLSSFGRKFNWISIRFVPWRSKLFAYDC